MNRYKQFVDELIDSLTEKSINSGVIVQDDVAIYRYGLKHLLLMPVYVGSYFLIGIFTQNVVWLFIFLLAFTLIRVFAGGYHAKHRGTCFIITMTMISITSLALKSYKSFIYIPMWIVCIILGYIVIMKFAPMDSKNRLFDAEEKRYFRRVTVIITNVELILFVIMIVIKQYHMAFVLTLVFGEEAILLLLGKLAKDIEITHDS